MGLKSGSYAALKDSVAVAQQRYVPIAHACEAMQTAEARQCTVVEDADATSHSLQIVTINTE